MPQESPWTALLDDAPGFAPGDTPLDRAIADFASRTVAEGGELIHSLPLLDTDLPRARDVTGPVTLVVSGGAGQLAGPAELARRLGLDVVAAQVAVRDLDDPVGAVRRLELAVDAARAEDALGEDVAVHVELPGADPTPGWLAAADLVAEAGHRLTFRLGGATADATPPASTLARWIEAAQDRDTAFRVGGGLAPAVRSTDRGHDRHGLVNLMRAITIAWDGASAGDVVDVLEERDRDTAARWARDLSAAGVRRWLAAAGTYSVSHTVADLRDLGLV